MDFGTIVNSNLDSFAVNSIFHISPKDKRVINVNAISILDSISKVNLNKSEEQRKILISYLDELMSFDMTIRASNEDVKMQARLFYVTIIVGLFSVLFSKFQKKFIIQVILLFVIGFIYLLEVHRNDLFQRTVDSYDVKGNAVSKLVNLNSIDSTFFVLNFNPLLDSLKIASGVEKRITRKLYSVIQPDPEQIVFYLSPFVLLWIYRINDYYKKRAKKNNKILE